MPRRYMVLALALVAAIAMTWPAFGATPLSRIRKLERQVRLLVLQGLQHDELQTVTVTGPISFQGTYGTGSASCPFGMKVTGGGVQWNGQFGVDSAVYASQPLGNGWSVAIRGGAGTTGFAQAVAVCMKLG